jgi:hypothetical protein
VARDLAFNPQDPTICFLRATVLYTNDGVAKTLGRIPGNSIILKNISGVNIDTVFNAGTTNTLNVGTSTDDNLFGTLLALGTAGWVSLDEAVTMDVGAADVVITATVVLTGTAATTGEAEVVVAYVPPRNFQS